MKLISPRVYKFILDTDKNSSLKHLNRLQVSEYFYDMGIHPDERAKEKAYEVWRIRMESILGERAKIRKRKTWK